MTLIRTSLLGFIAAVVRIAALLGVNKILAMHVGPAGYAALGQFQNMLQIATSLSGGATTNGIVKYTAEYSGDLDRQRRLWSTACVLSIPGVLLFTFAPLFFGRSISIGLFGSDAYRFPVMASGLCIFAFVANSFLVAILNGKKDVPRYVAINVFGSVISVASVLVLVPGHGLVGALLALSTYQVILLLIAIWFCRPTDWLCVKAFCGATDYAEAKKLLKYSLMALTTSIVTPISQLAVREHVGQVFGWVDAGLIEATWRFSAAYLMIATTSLSIYFLPRYSELDDSSLIWKEVRDAYLWVLPSMAVVVVAMLLGRDLIIDLMFDGAFSGMRDIMTWQLIGDFFKIGSWVVSYIMLGKALFRPYLISEVVAALVFYSLSVILSSRNGPAGVGMAYAITYCLYWIGIYIAVKHALARR